MSKHGVGGVEPSKLVIVGNTSEDPFAIDLAFSLGQTQDIADLISLKTFANSELCPRFISDESDLDNIGSGLVGMTVVIVSTSNLFVSRQDLAMRNLLIARSARENGAEQVILVEPDLYFSAQDRGPNKSLGVTQQPRSVEDLKKFDGQPFSALLYAEMLKLAGVDRVVTVHNHSHSVQQIFKDVFKGAFHNLIPYDIYADYLTQSNVLRERENMVLVAPDAGAKNFVVGMANQLGLPESNVLQMEKKRLGEREVEIKVEGSQEQAAKLIEGRDVVMFDDMVRTGSTVVNAFKVVQELKPSRAIFTVSHFYASEEGRENMSHTAIDEILTLNSLPTVLNRDVQGRLRRKMVVLKIERWLAKNLARILDMDMRVDPDSAFYQIDMSSTNPRFQRKIHSNDELSALKR